MKRSQSNVDERRVEILNRIMQQKQIRVRDLAEDCAASCMTIRRDLQWLEEQGAVTRFHGGAAARDCVHHLTEDSTVQRCRKQIARFSAGLVENGDAVFLNGSQTALMMLDYIHGINVHVITNNGRAIGKKYSPGVQITLTGGEPRPYIMVGEYAMRGLLSQEADKAFIGCAGITDSGELCCNIPTEIGINEAIISRASKGVFILADHTRIFSSDCLPEFYGRCAYDVNWTLITDDKADPKAVAKLRNLGKKVFLVSIED